MRKIFGLVLGIAFLCVVLSGCDCGCNADREDLAPYELTHQFLMLDEEGLRYDKLDILKYNVDDQVMTVFYSYGQGIVEIEMSGTSNNPKDVQDQNTDGILGQESYFDY